jgi:hypothetical protein
VSSTTRTYRRSPVRQDAFSETVDYGDFGVATGTQTVRRDPGNTTTTAYPGDFEYGWGPGSASAKLRAEREHYAKTGVDMPKYDENDLIERHRNLFKAEEKPFTPRMLHNNRQASRLSTMSCYCPPRRLRSNARSSEADGPNGNDDGRLASNTVVASNGSRQGTGAGLSDTLVNDTLRSVDGRYSQATPTGVPPLNISLDADNIRWLKELHQVQASRAKLAKHAAHGQGRDGSPRAGRRLSNQDAAPGTATGGTTSDPVNGGGGLEAAKQRIGE